MKKRGLLSIVKPTIFKAVVQFFPQVAQLANGDYSLDNFYTILEPLFAKISVNKIKTASSMKIITAHFAECMNKGFTL